MENGAKKEIKLKHMRASLPRLFLAPIWASNFFAGPFITAGDKRVYVILFNT